MGRVKERKHGSIRDIYPFNPFYQHNKGEKTILL